MVDIQHDKNERSYTYTQAENVDKGGNLVAPENAKGDSKEAAKHKGMGTKLQFCQIANSIPTIKPCILLAYSNGYATIVSH